MVIVRELRSAVRVLLASPGFLVLGSVMLAIGIAATTFVFSVVNGVLLKDSRLPDLTKIVNVSLTYNGESRPDMGLTARRFEALLARAPRSIDQITAVRHLQLAFDGGTQSRIVMAESVTRDYFGLLRVRPAAGRFLNHADDDMGMCCSVVVSYRVATQEFGSAERAIGQQVRLSGWPFTIVGVAREEFRGLTFPTMIGAELWINQQATTVALGSDQNAHPSRVFGRVADQTTLAVAAKELRSIGVGIDPKPEIGLTALPADDAVMPTGAVRASTVFGAVLLGLSGLILVAGVSNLTNLCAVRVARRTTEFAVRLALGARRVDLAYLFISEVLLVTVCGALMGWPLAVWAARALQRSTFPEMGGIIVNVDLAPDLRVAMFTVALTVVTTIGVSLAVLNRVLDSESVSVLARGVNVGLATWQRRSLRVALAVQVASAVVLLVPAGLFLRSAITQTHNLPQLGVDHALIGRFDLRLQRISEEKGQAIYAAILGQAARSAKVAGATLATDVPIDGRGPVVTLGAPGETGGVRARQLVVSPTFFEFLGIGLIRGRAFQASDAAGSESVVILSHSAAEAMWGQGDPIGRRVRVGDRGETRTVVGVVADVDESAQVELRRYAYLAQEQAHDPSLALLVRLRGAIPQRVEEIRSVVREADSGLALINATTLGDYVGLAANASKTAATAALIMAGVAWFICLGGVYAVAEYGSAARRREFGMRVALGATRLAIVRLVLQQAVPSVSRGVLAGWLVACAAASVLHVYWPSAAPWDWATIMSIPVLAGTVCFGAAVLPAWRASGVSPKDVLRP